MCVKKNSSWKMIFNRLCLHSFCLFNRYPISSSITSINLFVVVVAAAAVAAAALALVCECCLYTINKIHVLSVFLSSIVIGLTFFGHRRAEKMKKKKKNQRIASQNVVVIIVVVVAPFEFCFSFIIKKHNKITFTS